MSASSKKKLRKEQAAAQMTEKQLAEQKEAKKLKLYTTIFVAVLAVMVVIAIFVGVTNFITGSGTREKNTVAVTAGQHEISNAELNYYYIDAINNYYGNYGEYIAMFGLDVTKALNEQYYDEEAGQTWADYFLTSASENARSVYAMNDAAAAEGFTLSDEQTASIDSTISTVELYAGLYGYQDGESYLKAMYGRGASMKSYREYVEMSMLADAYYTAHNEGLTYDDAALRAADDENPAAYSAYTYNYYYLGVSKFQEGGVTGEDGTVTYTDEEKAAAVAAAEEAANSLVSDEIATVEDFDAAIAALEINAGTSASSTLCDNYGYNSVNSILADWVTDSARQEGDMVCIPNSETDVTGYYVVRFQSVSDNTYTLKNVRHILVGFEHNHVEGEEHDHSEVTYTEEEIAAAKAEAEEILNQWKSGEATEDSFATLANEKSDDGDGTTGGLYENVYKGQMVAPFEEWCYDSARAAGDTGIVETEYGFHVMYFVGDSETNYRDYLITNELRTNDQETWYTGLCDALAITEGDTSYIAKDLVLSAG